MFFGRKKSLCSVQIRFLFETTVFDWLCLLQCNHCRHQTPDVPISKIKCSNFHDYDYVDIKCCLYTQFSSRTRPSTRHTKKREKMKKIKQLLFLRNIIMCILLYIHCIVYSLCLLRFHHVRYELNRDAKEWGKYK